MEKQPDRLLPPSRKDVRRQQKEDAMSALSALRRERQFSSDPILCIPSGSVFNALIDTKNLVGRLPAVENYLRDHKVPFYIGSNERHRLKIEVIRDPEDNKETAFLVSNIVLTNRGEGSYRTAEGIFAIDDSLGILSDSLSSLTFRNTFDSIERAIRGSSPSSPRNVIGNVMKGLMSKGH